MALSFATLNTGGCSEELKNLSVRTYVDLTLHNPEIVLLQETYNLTEHSSCWEHWPYRVLCAQGDVRGTGVAILLKKSCDFNILATCTIFKNYILYLKIELDSIIYHVYNFLIPQKDRLALDCIDSFLAHCKDHNDGFVVLGGDFNCTANPALDRFCNPNEKRHKVAQALENSFNELSITDVWRRQNPTKCEYTWFRNNPKGALSKSRLDKILISDCLLPSVCSCNISPCAISDHSAVSLDFKLESSRRRGSSHWHFNNSLLENREYTDSIFLFLKQWHSQKSNYGNICTWWDVGKCHIKTLSQMFGCKMADIKRQTFKNLNEKIEQLQSSPELSPDTQQVLREQRNALRSLYEQEARGALIRARFMLANEVDASSSYFFGMEKSSAMGKRLSKIRLPNGTVTDTPSEINSHVRDFYANLYRRVNTEEGSGERIFHNIPTLDPCDAEDCDRPLSIEELDVAVKQLSHNKSPGLDGLTPEFYQFFWPALKTDLLSVFNESILSGSLPVSCRRAVITLLPKKGDLLDIANWRPVSLLNTDYKIYAKVLTNRLKNVIHQVVHHDQSYGVPGRSISDNTNLIRDSLLFCNSNNLPLALLNLDQKKAFDNVDHDYLVNTLKAMGFGQRFISYIQIMYSNAQSFLKVGGSLTSPFPFQKGIRQGCPLSGLLYSIAIEPLLHTLRIKLTEFGLKNPCGSGTSITVSAYADDVTVFLTDTRGFDIVRGVYSLYSRASAASLNPVKSQGLWAGSWVSRSDQPLDFKWNSEGLVFLGVHLGNSNFFIQKNWQACRQKLDKCLSSWKRLSFKMSLKGRVLVANQLAASKLFHTLATLSPPENVLAELQGKIINFIWNGGKHWLKKSILYQTPDRGGLGLTCLQARVFTSRFNLLRSFLKYPHHHPSFDFIRYYFRQYRKLGLDHELFTTVIDSHFFAHLPTFHSELMRAWTTIGARVATLPSNFSSFVNLPLNSSFFTKFDRDGRPPGQRLMACGIRLVRHLLDENTGAWLPPERCLSSTISRTSTRCLSNDLGKIQSIICTLSKDFNRKGCCVERINLLTLTSDPAPPPDIKFGADIDGLIAITKTIYDSFNTLINCLPVTTVTHWHSVGYINDKNNFQWKETHRLPTSKGEGDIQFKLFHNILPSLTVLHHIDPRHSPQCGWCGDRAKGTIEHLFITCLAIQPSLNLLHALLQRLLPETTLTFDSYWTLIPHARGRGKEVVRLCNYLIISLKSSIYWLYSNSFFTDPLVVWRNRVKHRILSDCFFYKSSHNFHTFKKIWHINDSIFMLTGQQITWFI